MILIRSIFFLWMFLETQHAVSVLQTRAMQAQCACTSCSRQCPCCRCDTAARDVSVVPQPLVLPCLLHAVCAAGYGGVNCTACGHNTYSTGGQAEGTECMPCAVGSGESTCLLLVFIEFVWN